MTARIMVTGNRHTRGNQQLLYLNSKPQVMGNGSLRWMAFPDIIYRDRTKQRPDQIEMSRSAKRQYR